jgi:hypothetical protein
MKPSNMERIDSSMFRSLDLEQQAQAIGGVSGPVSEVVTVVTTSAIHPTPDSPDRIIDQG